MPKPRSPVHGFNHNIRHRGWLFHVQTEDSGVQNPHLFTHLFHEGVIITTKKMVYDAEADVEVVRSLMQAQHKSVLKELKKGKYDDKIERYLGPAPALADNTQETADSIPEDKGPELTVPMELPEVPAEHQRVAKEGSLGGKDPSLDGAADSFDPLAAMLDDDDAAVTVPLPIGPQVAERRMTPASAWHVHDPIGEEGDVDLSAAFQKLSSQPVVEATPVPSAKHAKPQAPVSTVWVSRPGMQERPFEKSGRVGNAGTQSLGRPSDSPQSKPTHPPPSPTSEGLGAPVRSERMSGSPANQVPHTTKAPVVPATPALAVRASPSPKAAPAKPAVIVGSPPLVIGQGSQVGQQVGTGDHPREASDPTPPESIFGQDLISEKSLDEVILAYLSEDASKS
ncbi:MAG: hypothetical protein HY698_11210 [Deltaproteobacteria bacterium]|nr:hypothetical protein [Deltaproteobacteria bacterium]